MSHRVHTILSILAEDHAPAALRPSILLAIDWPTVAEEAPATGDDASAATLVALRLRGAVTDNHPAIASLAARLATVAASLSATGDKAMTTHATALWGAATALVGLPVSAITNPSTAEVYLRALASKASDLFQNPGDISTPAKQATIIGTAIDKARAHARDITSQGVELNCVRDERDSACRKLDKALADIHALRDILKVPAGGNLVDHADAVMKGAAAAREDGARLRAQVDRMIAAMREDAPAPAKPRPQPGDVVPWDEVEDGCLYFDFAEGLASPFLARQGGREGWLDDEDDRDVYKAADGRFGQYGFGSREAAASAAILVARDLGPDPEAWRQAMREWTASESSRPR